ncbi:E3 ubiquitin-protein ligase XIAP-like [Odontomachus brunneus]|uniref:E3 ubiquitin-protein ligase XIAP-like n=1 Tax=Odontomachus brunneus TaxID=486640 RepID=UPI0013F2ABFC|nr:E3 ubiquitin-protein ligase XIAP-like [Odontomachus brunneus]XP_032681187.1 E3 ubiquitin-protein ligase XIAP-like [Odontomachus brunneus]
MTPRTQRAEMFYEIPPTVRLMSFKNVPYNVIIDEVDEVDSLDYRYELIRIQSFKNWPVPYMKPEKLAAAGFYYTGELDIVKCFECGTETYKWQEGDEPLVDHKRQSPTCRFLRNIVCNNISASEIADNVSPIVSPLLEGRDVCGPYKHDLLPDYYNPTNSSSTYPKYLEYKRYEVRFRSFEHWPTSFKQNPKQLSLAGFYYTGRGDQVLCFHCGVGVKDWEPNDDPWEQHAIWYPNCNYLLEVKGPKYVEEITGRTISSKDTASCVAKVEQSVDKRGEAKHIKFAEEDHLPGPSSQSSRYSDDSAVESMSSNNSSINGSNENLSDTKTESCSKPISDTRMCKICFDAEVSQLFLPCSHLVTCVNCAKCIKTCPMCREFVTGQMKVFFS